MKATIIQSIQILSLALVIADGADAQANNQANKINESANLPAVQCTLTSAGFINGNYANIRIQQGDQVIAGAASLESVIASLNDLQSQGVCSVAVHPCELAIGGLITSGQWAKQRLLVNGEPLFGAGDMGSLLAQLNRLRSESICN